MNARALVSGALVSVGDIVNAEAKDYYRGGRVRALPGFGPAPLS